MPGFMKRALLGRPLHTEESAHQRLANPIALAVFSSDALSSTAYATEEILLVLVLAGAAAMTLSVPIAMAIGTLMVVVAISYRQTIKAYPGGGGAYIVAHENLGETPGLIAGASLLVDYILTVAVSISAGTAAVTSAFPDLRPYTVPLAIFFTVLLAVANLRGVKESGALFSGPTFFFVGMLALMIVVGLGRYALGGSIEVSHEAAAEGVATLSLFLVLRAFASGCAALTGIEAIANGVQAFRHPEADNARKTLAWMAGILLFLFLGTTLLARLSGVAPAEGGETVISQLARATFGGGLPYFLLQGATAAILVLAANTAYADFPRLGSFIACDGFLPKQLMDRGYRLVYSNGIILLTGVAVALLIGFRGDTHRLIPLYAVGVFTSFTLSQSGMVVHWLKAKHEDGWKRAAAINAFGATATFVVLVVLLIAKFTHGAWAVAVLVPVLVTYFKWVKRHYDDVKRRLEIPADERSRMSWRSVQRMHNHVVLLVGGIDRRLVRAVQYAKSLKADKIEGIYVDASGEGAEQMREQWEAAQFGFRLTVIPSPYREIIQPIEDYVRNIPRPTPDHVVTVIIPEFVPENVVDNIMHNQTAFWIKNALFDEPGVIVVDVPFRLSGEHPEDDRAIAPSPF